MPQKMLQKIQLASLHLLEALSTDQLYKTIIEEAVVIAEAEHASLFLEKNGLLVRVYSTVPMEFRLNPRLGGNTYTAFETGEMKLLSRAAVFEAHPEAHKQFESSIMLPLSYHTKRVGILTIPVGYSEVCPEMASTLKVFASLCVLAIRNIDLYEQAQTALKNRELFMSAAAHELKTPLTTIRAYAQVSQKKLEKKQPVDPKWIDAILQNSYRLQALITDLFSMSQMKMGVFTYSFEQMDLFDKMTQIISDIAISFKRTITFKNLLGDEAPMIEADHDKLTLAFTNILTNAIKYSPGDTPIAVVIQKKKKHYLVSITDRGQGISADDLPHIFEQNYQGQHKEAKGMGLGMYLCKQIIEAHHGEVEISSELGKGTTVDVYLPSGELNR